ncbi:hypothetical protein Tco_0302923 [Tanacetum coccineum]
MFKLEDVAMGIWIADLKKNGLEVRYDQEGVYNEETSSSGGRCNILLLQLDTGFFNLVFVVDIAIVVEDSTTWICSGCGGVGDSSSSYFEILIVGIGPIAGLGLAAAYDGGGRNGPDDLVEVVVELEVDLVIRVMVGLMVKGPTQEGDQGRGQGNGRNQNGDAINDNIRGDVRNIIENNDHKGCTYKEFLACNPKECDRKGGAIVYTRWIEKMESVQDMSGCRDNQKVKYIAGSFVGKDFT